MPLDSFALIGCVRRAAAVVGLDPDRGPVPWSSPQPLRCGSERRVQRRGGRSVGLGTGRGGPGKGLVSNVTPPVSGAREARKRQMAYAPPAISPAMAPRRSSFSTAACLAHRRPNVDDMQPAWQTVKSYDCGVALQRTAPYVGASASRCSPEPLVPSGREVFCLPKCSEPKYHRPDTEKQVAPMDQVLIFDTTLRDGEQSPGISLDVGEKLEIADQLARLGVDVIEAGFPIASDGDFEAVEAIAKTVQGPIIAGLVPDRVQGRRPGVGGGAPRRAQPDPHLPGHLRAAHEEEAPDDPRPGEGRGRGERRPGQGLHRGRRVLAGGRVPLGPRLHVRGLPDRGRQRRDDAEHPRHGRLRPARGLRPAHRVRDRHGEG